MVAVTDNKFDIVKGLFTLTYELVAVDDLPNIRA